MSVFKDKTTGLWTANASYSDWKGVTQKKQKRGFATKREAVEWKRDFLNRYADNLNMTLGKFVEIYAEERRPRLKLNTWLTKEHIIETKILPYFADKPMNEITARDIIRWQNTLIEMRTDLGKPLSGTYLKTIHNQLTAIFTHAYKFYGLTSNPSTKAGSMGKRDADEMSFWTRDEYALFAKSAMQDQMTFYAYEVLYWSGMRLGEMLALTLNDINFMRKTIRVNKSYQRLQGEDVITDPKTKKSKRVITIPDQLCLELKQYAAMQYDLDPEERLFKISKSTLSKHLKSNAKEAGLNQIRIHDLRHSHVSLLIELGFSAVAIADRLGHESVEITYRYAHLFPQRQVEMASKLDSEMKVDSYEEE